MNKQELLTKLFHWSIELPIVDQFGVPVTTVYQRVVGDYDLQTARKASLRYTSQLRAKVTKEDSDDYQIYVAPVFTLTRDEKETLALYDSVFELQQEAERMSRLPEPKEPEGHAPTAEFEEYVQLDDTYEDRYLKILNDNTQKLMDRRKEEIAQLSDDELAELVVKNRINALCESELKSKFFEYCVYLGTYEDSTFKKRLYATFEDFNNIPEFLKMQLFKSYADLEMTAINLKESQKTPSLDQPLT
jgi:hypothetical protein